MPNSIAPARKLLRPYQVRLVTDACRDPGNVLVEQPTGSGKTIEIVTIVGMLMGRRFTHAVIAAPQEQVEDGFVHRDYSCVGCPEHPGVATPDVEVPEEFIWGARHGALGSVSRVIAYLRQAEPGHALACTHAALNRLVAEKLPDDLSGKALVVDEAHHASADGLSEIISLWRKRNGLLYFFTATPYRGDDRPVVLQGMRAYRRSLAQHMAEGFAPRYLETEIVALGHRGDRITGGILTGDEAPPAEYFDAIISRVCQRWLDDGKPKAIIRVPPMRGGSSGLVARLIHALRSNHARVLDATGTGVADKKRFLRGLQAEKARCHADSVFDVVIGIQRVMEGTDWPVCSAVYCVGMPGSLNTVVQLLGRAMRPKDLDYPEAHRERARLVFFVPSAGGSALPELSMDHSRHALLTCCFLADHEIGQEWIVLRQVHRGIEQVFGATAQSRAAADAEIEADEPLNPEVRAEVELALASAREQLISKGGEPTLGQVLQLAAQTRSDLPESAFHRVAAEVLVLQPCSTGIRAQDAIDQQMAKRLRIDPTVKQAMAEAFAVVLHEFRDATLEESIVLETIGRQIHAVTGGQMRAFAQRLRDAAPRPLSEEQILAWADTHYQLNGEWPGQYSGPVCSAPGEKWANTNAALREGLRGLPGKSSLAKLLYEKRGVRTWASAPDLSRIQIHRWVADHFERTCEFPTRQSGVISGSDGETWLRVDAALKTGLRGLPGGSSLALFLHEEFGVRSRKALPRLTTEHIKGWVTAFYDRTGEYPTHLSGEILGTNGETWGGVDAAMKTGSRGFDGDYSLARLLEDEFGVRNVKNPPRLTKELIRGWILEHHTKLGNYPTSASGIIAGTNDETWQAVNLALWIGRRGLPGGSSLAQFLEEEFRVRNRGNLPQLRRTHIRAWIMEWYKNKCKYPTRNDAEIPGSNGETWSGVDDALRTGRRGLLGGTSLAQFLEEEFKVRNRLRSLPLRLNQIKQWSMAWRERTGTWPSTKSGEVPEADNLTWQIVDKALRRGSRGLPGGSSLAQFLAEEFGVRNRSSLPDLTREQLKQWAADHKNRTGKYPAVHSGPIPGSAGESWTIVDKALNRGSRGLPGGSSLAQFLAEEFGVRNRLSAPDLTREQLRQWATDYHAKTGQYPTQNSGEIVGAGGYTWRVVDKALKRGGRALHRECSLANFLDVEFARRGRRPPPQLTLEQIRHWVSNWHQNTGEYPTQYSGEIPGTSGETWSGVHQALYRGRRGLPGGSSLALFLKKEFRVRSLRNLPKLKPGQIRKWVIAWHEHTGRYPKHTSGPIPETEETWSGVHNALYKGGRGMPGGSSLFRFIHEHVRA
jgi:hypothetical protein